MQTNGTSSNVTLKLEVKDGKLRFFDVSQENSGTINISKWTVTP
jgi:hypothetical protein